MDTFIYDAFIYDTKHIIGNICKSTRACLIVRARACLIVRARACLIVRAHACLPLTEYTCMPDCACYTCIMTHMFTYNMILNILA